MDGYELHEARYIQEIARTSAANALTLNFGTPVPKGKVWTILAGGYYPSVAEIRTVQWFVIGRGGAVYAIDHPVAMALSTSIMAPICTEGMEVKLFPGENILAIRDAATAGSTMTIQIRFIEADLPYYSYVEPLNKVVKSAQHHGSAYRASGSLSPGSPGSGQGSAGSGGVPDVGPSEPFL